MHRALGHTAPDDAGWGQRAYLRQDGAISRGPHRALFFQPGEERLFFWAAAACHGAGEGLFDKIYPCDEDVGYTKQAGHRIGDMATSAAQLPPRGDPIYDSHVKGAAAHPHAAPGITGTTRSSWGADRAGVEDVPLARIDPARFGGDRGGLHGRGGSGPTTFHPTKLHIGARCAASGRRCATSSTGAWARVLFGRGAADLQTAPRPNCGVDPPGLPLDDQPQPRGRSRPPECSSGRNLRRRTRSDPPKRAPSLGGEFFWAFLTGMEFSTTSARKVPGRDLLWIGNGPQGKREDCMLHKAR